MTEYVTKDSGQRAHFESGMQRDTEDGKPRFDLLHPLGVPFAEQFLTRCAALLGRGAVKYDARNWEMASGNEELARFKSSAARHFEQWLTGETDEDHAAAVFFNLLAHETTAYKLAKAEADSNTLEEEAERWSEEPRNGILPCGGPAVMVGHGWQDIGYTTDAGVEWRDPEPRTYAQAVEARPHLFDDDGDIWQQVTDDHWVLMSPDGSEEGEPEEWTAHEIINSYGIQDKQGFPEVGLAQRWVAEYDEARPWRLPEVDEARHWRLPEVDLTPFNEAISEAVAKLADPAVWRATERAQEMAKAVARAEDYAWALRFNAGGVGFIGTSEGIVDMRDMIQDALNRRA